VKGVLLSSTLALAAAAGTISDTSAHEPPPEIRVGVIDVEGRSLSFDDRNTDIHYRAFPPEGSRSATWQTESGFDHGDMMASAFVRQMRKIAPDAKLRIFSANVFYENSASSALHALAMRNMSSQRTIAVNWDGVGKALDWMKENGVKVVITAFNGRDTEQMRGIMAKAQENGMVVFASAGNKVGGNIYPAAYKEAISVAGDNRDLSFRQDASIATWVNFTMDGAVPLARHGRPIDEGSSFATAKAAALGAYYSFMNPSASAPAIRSAMSDAAQPMSYHVNGTPVVAMRFDDEAAARRIIKVAADDAHVAYTGKVAEVSPAIDLQERATNTAALAARRFSSDIAR
jgi:hypothetical protein